MNRKEKILAFIPLAIACFLTVLDSTIVNVSLPTMAKYFNTNITGISWVSTAYLIPFSALLINFSKIADIYGRKKLLLIGLVVFGTASICCGLSISLPMIICFRILQGIGAAILTPLAIPLGIELFGKSAMGKLAIAIGMIISISAASGPVIGGILNESFGFKAIFYINIPFILIALVLGTRYVKECYDNTIEKKVDFIGAFFITFGLAALTFSLVKGNDYGWASTTVVTLIASSVISIIAFLIFESKIKSPMIEFNLFKTKSYTASIILIGIIFFGLMPVSYLMNFYLENQLGYAVIKAGLILGITSAVAFFLSPIFSLLSKKTSPKVVSFIAVTFVSLGNLIFFFMNSTNNMNIIYTALILLGVGVGATTPLYQSAFEEISQDKNGMASGILNSLRQLTACIAIALVATLSTHFSSIAATNTKNQIMDKVNGNIVIEEQVKKAIITKIKASNTDGNSASSTGFSKESVKRLINEKEKTVLASLPPIMKSAVMAKFSAQEKEIYKIIDEAKIIKMDESNKVYSKCFLIIGIVAAFGLIVVPFNVTEEKEDIEDKSKVTA